MLGRTSAPRVQNAQFYLYPRGSGPGRARSAPRSGALCLAQAPQKRKSGVSLGCSGRGTCASERFIVIPEAGARSAASGKASAPQGTSDCRLPADSAPPSPAREGARPGIKPCMPRSRAAFPISVSISVSTALIYRVNARCSGRVFSGRGRAT